MKAVQILGLAPNISDTPSITGFERWCSNVPRSYQRKGFNEAKSTYTRWFNVHSIRHIKTRYPSAYRFYQAADKPIYLQEAQLDIPTSITFPRDAIQQHFAIDGQPNKFFTCSISWLIAFAIMEGFERIDLWGFELRREHQYDWERPCFFYWVERARSEGIEVYIPPGVIISEPGDPHSYDGPLYGYEPHSEFYARYF